MEPNTNPSAVNPCKDQMTEESVKVNTIPASIKYVYDSLENKSYSRGYDYLDMLLQKKVNLVTFSGLPGIGKTILIKTMLSSYGLNESIDYFKYDGRLTIPVLVDDMESHPEKIFILEDIAEFAGGSFLDILLSATDDKKIRRIRYLTDRERQEFDFYGSIILSSNKDVNKTPLLRALTDRGFHEHFDLTAKDKFEFIKMVIIPSMEDTETKKTAEIICRLMEEKNSLTGTNNFSYRNFDNLVKIGMNNLSSIDMHLNRYFYKNGNKTNEYLSAIRNNPENKELAAKEYGEKTGQCRKSFFNVQKRHKQIIGKHLL